MNYVINFLSKRNLPLILVSIPEKDQPILTIENAREWEEASICVVYDDGTVSSILDDKYLARVYSDVTNEFDVDQLIAFRDGIWSPEFLITIAERMGFEWDDVSWDLLHGRWSRTMTKLHL